MSRQPYSRADRKRIARGETSRAMSWTNAIGPAVDRMVAEAARTNPVPLDIKGLFAIADCGPGALASAVRRWDVPATRDEILADMRALTPDDDARCLRCGELHSVAKTRRGYCAACGEPVAET